MEMSYLKSLFLLMCFIAFGCICQSLEDAEGTDDAATITDRDNTSTVKRESSTRYQTYAPRNVSIIPDKETFYTKLYGKPNVDVVCKADCVPSCSYTWYYANHQMPPSSVFATGETLFAKRQFGDKGYPYFYCRASNYLDSSNSKWITMIVKDGPENVTITPSKTPKENSPFSLVCSANCLHGCTSYRWSHGGIPLENKAVLNFQYLSRSNNGKYTCFVEDYFGTMSNSYEMDVQYTNVILERDTVKLSLTVKEFLPSNVKCRIECNFDGCPTRINVTRNLEYYRTIISSSSIFGNRKADIGDSGVYSCSFENWKSLKNFKLDILYGPRNVKITKTDRGIELENIKERKYKTISLLCSSICRPPCGIHWYKDGTLLSGQTNETLHLPRNRTVSGNYTCEANGVEGRQTSDPVKVTVIFPPESVRIIPDKDIFYSKREGTPYDDVVCKADCLPPCTYTWYYSNYRSQRIRGSFFTTGDTLFATKNFIDYNYKYFYCMVSNNLGSSYSKWITVSVKDGPENVTITPSQIPKENSPFSLVCSANCLHGCTSYRWSFGNKWLDESKLTFNRLSRTDHGKYICSVKDYFGWRSASYMIDAQYSPTNVTVHIDSSYGHLKEKQDYIRISCNADCNPECSYQFYRSGKLLNAGYLQLSSWAYRNMSGQYTCSAKNSVANIYKNSSNFVDVYIKYKPSIAFSFSANRTQITAPGSLDLSFTIDSFPPSNVTVYHIKDKLRTFPNATGQHSFVTSITSCLDEGEYRLKAVNDVGSDSDTVFVDVLCSPMIMNFVNVSYHGFKIGERLELTVAFKGNPKPEASWIFNPWNSNASHSVQLQRIQNQLTNRTAVVIQTLNAIDFGIYKLQLINNYGNISKEFKIQGPPTEPTDLYVECPGPANVFWKPGFDGGSEQTFIIEYTSNRSFWQIHRQTSAAVFTDDYLKSFVDDISPNILYFFRIKAKNSFGEAISESEVNCTQQRQPATSNEPSLESSTMLNKTAISEDTVLSPTSRRRKTINVREMEMKNLVLEHTKLGEEIQKLRAERKVLELKQQYYTARLKQILKDHSG